MTTWIIWWFQVAREKQKEFEEIYGEEGDWATLFRRSPFYRGTLLLRQIDFHLHYLTLDQWDDLKSFEEFLFQNESEYVQIDKKCEHLTISEEKIGVFEKPFDPSLIHLSPLDS